MGRNPLMIRDVSTNCPSSRLPCGVIKGFVVIHHGRCVKVIHRWISVCSPHVGQLKIK